MLIQNLNLPKEGLDARTFVDHRFAHPRCHGGIIAAQHDFPNTTGIVNYYDGGVLDLAVDSTNFRVGSAGVRMEIPDGLARYRYGNASQWSAVDVSGGFEIEVSWWTPSSGALSGECYVELFSNGTSSNAWQGWLLKNSSSQEIAPGYHRGTTNTSVWSANWDPSAVTGWAIRAANCSAGQYIVVDQIKLLKGRTGQKPIIIFRSDDGWQSAEAMAKYLQKYGYYLTIGIIGSAVGTGSYMTVAQLQRLAREGHLIVNHTWSHRDWSTLTEAECLREYTKNRDWMYANGLGEGASILMSPYFWYAPAGGNESLITKNLSQGTPILTGARKTPWAMQSGNTTVGGQYHILDTYDTRTIPVRLADASATAAAIATLATTAKGGPQVLLYHHLDSGGITTTNFRAAVEQVRTLEQAGTVKVMSYLDYLDHVASYAME
jgi:peptidoglycan/xylan/chitin deacetylase (PgdA/CDA1 family)